MDIKDYKSNIDTLIKWNYAYNVLDAPIATDDEYDKLYRMCKEFEDKNPSLKDKNSPIGVIGNTILSKFVKGNHYSKMWSQEDIFNSEELLTWYNKVIKFGNNIKFYCQPKFDGVSLNLVYDNGILIKALTRGDGNVGEDVTNNARVIKNIPLTIKHKHFIEIRGEVTIKKDDFIELNKERLEKGEQLFANPRNAAAGSLRQLDSSVTANRKLYFNIWGIGKGQNIINMYSDLLSYFYKEGFNKPVLEKVVTTIEEIENVYQNYIKERDKIDTMLDGMVIKVDNIELHNTIGYTNKFPKWSCAYKFPAEEKVALIKDFITQVGRTGIVTPVALIEPVDVGGVIVSKVTLNNFEDIIRKDIRIGDNVVLIRSGDVIPKIIGVFKDRRTGKEIVINKPTICPSCGEPLVYEDTFVKCINKKCTQRVVNIISYYASRKCMNIDGLGYKVVEVLVKNNLVNDVTDLYKLTYDDLIKLDNFKDKKIMNLLTAIENSKGCYLYKFITSLGIDNFGETLSKVLCKKYKFDILNLTFEELISNDGIGDNIANDYINFLKDNKTLIDTLYGIIKPILEEEIKESTLTGKTIVITGSLSIPRDVMKYKLENMGMVIKPKVNSKVDYLLYSETTSTKYRDAIEYGITTITEEELNKLLEG